LLLVLRAWVLVVLLLLLAWVPQAWVLLLPLLLPSPSQPSQQQPAHNARPDNSNKLEHTYLFRYACNRL
jgi:hypothetical protein